MRQIWILFIVISAMAGCASQNAPPGATTAPPQQTPHPQYNTIDITSVAGIVENNLSIFYPDNFTVEMYGSETLLVPVRANPSSFEGEFPELVSEAQQNPALANTIINDIKLKDSYVYMETTAPSNIWVEYSVYEFNNPASAKTVIDLYSRIWNTLQLEYGNGSIWLWEGWKEQVTTGRIPDRYRSGAFCSWDPVSKFMIFADQGITDQILTSPATDIYCLHGEQARGPYFFMVDIHASPAIIDSVGEEAFGKIVDHIYNVSINESAFAAPEGEGGSLSGSNVSGGNGTVLVLNQSEKEIRDLENQIIELTRKYTTGEITYEQFDRLFTILDQRLRELKGE